VGDLDEEAAINAVAQTFGALPAREKDFLPRKNARNRPFTDNRQPRIVTHTGEPDQALIRLVWPTTDDTDHAEVLRLGLLARVVSIRLQEVLREELGQTYSPGARSSTSRTWRDYGTFSINVAVEYAQLDAARNAIFGMLGELRKEVNNDTVNRARQPLIERYDNLLKSLNGWMSLVDDAQSETERIDRYFDGPDMLRALRAEDIRLAAQTYLAPDDAVEIRVVPEESLRNPRPE